MALPRPIILDFETEPIQGRPHYPPKPVSFSLQLPTWKKPKFYAWAHKTGRNNCSLADAKRVLKAAYADVSAKTPLLCHNGKFDMDVAEVHMDCPLPPWHCWHDTMILLFLSDPHQRELGLKPSSERLLGLPPEEQDVVKQWILEHKRQLEQDFPEIVTTHGGIKPSTAGAFIAYAPPELAGPYADGDITRTGGLFKVLLPEILERGMGDAYDRERRLLPILLRNEREGIKVDRSALERDRAVYEAAQEKTDAWIRKALKAPTLDLNKDRDVSDALFNADAVTEWSLTATGKRSVSKKALKLAHFRDQKLAAAYSYRQRCATVLETFIRPWLHYSASDGMMRTTWNQVRQSKGGAGDTGGTRTGRPSSQDPNFLNMPKPFKEGGVGQYLFPAHIRGLPQLPKVRSYIVPSRKGWLIGRRDFAQQEIRLLAHFEDGALLQAYLDNPRLDVHEFTRLAILDNLGLDVGRGTTKTLMFGYIYGQGLGSLAETLERSVDEVKSIRNAQMSVLPGLKQLSAGIKARSAQGLPITTWGGRQYYVEPPKLIDGEWRRFEYKLLNYLIQGSAADVTKESIIRADAVLTDSRFILSVYDENDIEAPAKALKKEMLKLREAMMSIEVDVPLLSDGEYGPTLGDLEDLTEPLPDLSRWGVSW